jgi:hypothetical protein
MAIILTIWSFILALGVWQENQNEEQRRNQREQGCH